MAKHVRTPNNGNGGLAWVTRAASKINNKTLDVLGQNIKKFAKRYTSKKRRNFLKDENNL